MGPAVFTAIGVGIGAALVGSVYGWFKLVKWIVSTNSRIDTVESDAVKNMKIVAEGFTAFNQRVSVLERGSEKA